METIVINDDPIATEWETSVLRTRVSNILRTFFICLYPSRYSYEALLEKYKHADLLSLLNNINDILKYTID